MAICFVDTETTGLDKSRHEIIEIAILVLEGGQLKGYNQKIAPTHIATADPVALKINRYIPEACAKHSRCSGLSAEAMIQCMLVPPVMGGISGVLQRVWAATGRLFRFFPVLICPHDRPGKRGGLEGRISACAGSLSQSSDFSRFSQIGHPNLM